MYYGKTRIRFWLSPTLLRILFCIPMMIMICPLEIYYLWGTAINESLTTVANIVACFFKNAFFMIVFIGKYVSHEEQQCIKRRCHCFYDVQCFSKFKNGPQSHITEEIVHNSSWQSLKWHFAASGKTYCDTLESVELSPAGIIADFFSFETGN